MYCSPLIMQTCDSIITQSNFANTANPKPHAIYMLMSHTHLHMQTPL